VDDGLAKAGNLEIEMPGQGEPKPAWIVDGQQRALALSRCKRRDFPVPVNAFIADDVDLQKDQFLRINNTKPLPRGLITELLPDVSTTLPPQLAARKAPSKLCEILNRDRASPFFGLIRRASSTEEEKKSAVVSDSAVIKMIEESLTNPSGCLYPFRNTATGETDFSSVLAVLVSFWDAVRATFPAAWALPPTQSRLMHGAGILSMGRVMDRVMSAINPADKKAALVIRHELAVLKPFCCWTDGVWEGLGLRWNEAQNTPQHVKVLSNHLVRTYLHERRSVA
jgi:DGQHR domain-containing protein